MSLDSVPIHFRAWGSTGPRVILLHAIGLDHHSWDAVGPTLANHCQAVAADLPGHGESGKPAGADYSLPSMARRMIQLLDELGWDNAVFIGNSIGGGVSLASAILAPRRVRALSLVNSIAFRDGLPLLGRTGFLPIAPLIARMSPVPLTRIGLSVARGGFRAAPVDQAARVSGVLRQPDGNAAFFNALRRLYGPDLDRLSQRYPEITVPTLVMHGRSDPLIRFPHAERLVRTLPSAELVPVSGCGHFPQEERPPVVAEALLHFLKKVG